VTVLEALIQSLSRAGEYNRDDQVAPARVLWPDKEHQWKPLEQQPTGWHPDLNDGVRLNIRPFLAADVLRKRPNIKWAKDHGKKPLGSPWGEVRDNDRHLTLAEKREARNNNLS
jgi:hypothetical protein